ncbi:hypothetical protein GXW74_13020 [Roseomonas eburnea]|uniref:Uncharacterized protein n=1 Tax=Neoroseomonas eburnea TaxID=1346889 RepID=A0A9X9XCH5_9PROT|nr:DUF6683 family protein [Neoroseomonas eburnea]MBR0681411.1 hypothetical protein [Neoroseomonas eburnea]
MPRSLFASIAIAALAAAPGLAQAQKSGEDSRPAVMSFGAGGLGTDGAAAIGAGLRIFPAAGATPAPMPVPSVTPSPPPLPPSAALPGGKPAPAGAAPVAGAGKPSPLAPTGTAALRSPTAFTPTAAVTARVRQEVLAAALPTSPNPAGLRAAVQSGAPWQEFDRLLMQHGYDPRDLADVVGAFYLITWEVATGGDATTQPAGIAAVRGQVRQMLASAPNLARMSEAERQATAETLAFHAMAIAARHRDLHNAGADLVAYRAEVAQAVGQFQGIDLRRFTLTASGFQQR